MPDPKIMTTLFSQSFEDPIHDSHKAAAFASFSIEIGLLSHSGLRFSTRWKPSK